MNHHVLDYNQESQSLIHLMLVACYLQSMLLTKHALQPNCVTITALLSIYDL